MSQTPVNAAVISWTNTAGGNWSNPTNWDSGTVPGTNDSAFIAVEGSYVVTLDTDVNVGIVNLGALHSSQVVVWNSTNLVVNTFLINTNGILTVHSPSQMNLVGTITNNGQINWATTNKLSSSVTCAVVNNGLFQMITNFATTNFSYVGQYNGHVGTFNNFGTLLVGTNVGTINFMPDGMYFTNHGVITVGSNSTMSLTGTIGQAEPLAFNDGTLINGGGLLENISCQIIATGTITLNDSLELDGNGTIQGNQTWTGTGILNWAGGAIGDYFNSGNPYVIPTNTTTFGTNFHVNISTDSYVNSQIFDNRGTIFWNQGFLYNIANQVIFNNNGLMILQNPHRLRVQYNLPNYLPSIFNNNGTISVTNGSAAFLVSSGWCFTNYGTFSTLFSTSLELESYLTNGMTFADGTIINANGPVFFGQTPPSSYLTANGTITINGPQSPVGNVQMTDWAFVSGTQTWTGTGSVSLHNSSFLGSGTTTIDTNVLFYANGTLTLNGHTLNNGGILIPSLLYLLDGNVPSVFNNYGSLILAGSILIGNNGGYPENAGSSFYSYGTISMSVGGTSQLLSYWPATNSGTINVPVGSELDLYMSNLTLLDGSRFTGYGNVHLGYGDNRTFSCTLNATGNITVNVPVSIGSLTTVQGTQTWTGFGTLNWSGGSFAQAGTTTIAPNFNFSVIDDTNSAETSFARTISHHTFNNRGIFTWNSTTPIQMTNGALFQNSGIVILQTNCTVQPLSADCGFNNLTAGTLQMSSGNSFFNCPVTNSGKFDLEFGNLTLTNNFISTASSQYHFLLAHPGGQLNLGAFNPQGSINATVGTALPLVTGSSFDLINYTSHSGVFYNTEFPSLPGAYNWQAAYGAKSLSLNVTVGTRVNVTKSAMLADGTYQMSVSGPAAANCILLCSSNLVDWFPLQTNGPFTGSMNLIDKTATNYSQRFYRAVISD